MNTSFRVLVADLDGSLMPQGGPMDSRVAHALIALQQHGIAVWAATGGSSSYVRGFSAGGGFVWNGIIAEAGAHIFETTSPTPPVYREVAGYGVDTQPLSQFAKLINLDQLSSTFMLEGKRCSYRPEPKCRALSFFPSGPDRSESIPWTAYFTSVIVSHQLPLELQRHPDGCVDVVVRGVGKHLGVRAVCGVYQCTEAEVLSVIDGVNDIELALCTTPIAVANAIPRIKEITRERGGYCAQRIDGKGFVEGIHHFATLGRFGQASGGILNEIPVFD